MRCRHCQAELTHIFADLHHQPASNSFLTEAQLKEPEVYYPLKLYVCPECFLVQVDEHKNCEDIFDQNYVYFSSMSSSWLAHAKKYVEMVCERFGYNESSFVIEVASNDGYLLQYFQEKKIPCLGIEPTASTAKVSKGKGITTREAFWGTALAQELLESGNKADLILGNNVLAHVPDINDFVGALPVLLNAHGVVTFEFPHVMQLIEQNQFDTIYQEHYSYLSLHAVQRIFASQKMRIFDVEELSTHGGSLRIFATHAENTSHMLSPRVAELLQKEAQTGMTTLNYYSVFQKKIEVTKNNLLAFLLEQKKLGKHVAAYGAAAKGNTFLNLCGVKPDLISFCVDKAPSKQDKFMPGSHIPVFAPEAIYEQKPDYVLILPWNIKDEIMEEHAAVRAWGAQFVVAIPEMRVL